MPPQLHTIGNISVGYGIRPYKALSLGRGWPEGPGVGYSPPQSANADSSSPRRSLRKSDPTYSNAHYRRIDTERAWEVTTCTAPCTNCLRPLAAPTGSKEGFENGIVHSPLSIVH